MSKFRKFLLVDPDQYNKLLEKYQHQQQKQSDESLLTHPNIRNVKRIDNQITEILQDKKLTDTEKMESYAAELDSFLRNFRGALETSKRDAFLGPKTSPADSMATAEHESRTGTSPAKTLDDSSVTAKSHDAKKAQEDLYDMSTLPKSYQGVAQQLSTFLQQNPNYTINENGEVKYKDSDNFGPNIAELLNGVVRYKTPLTGRKSLNRLVETLKEEGFPISRLGYVKKQKLNPLPLGTTNKQMHAAGKVKKAKERLVGKNPTNGEGQRNKKSLQQSANAILAKWK